MDPPAGFVRACNPAVAAPRAPLPPEDAHFWAAHHPDRTAYPHLLRPLRSPSGPSRSPEMPVDFTGYWKMLANENFEEYLRALGKRCPPRSARAPRRTSEGGIPAPFRAGRPSACLGQAL